MMRRGIIAGLVVLVALITAAGLALRSLSPGPVVLPFETGKSAIMSWPESEPTQTRLGRVIGRTNGRSLAFLGLRYGALSLGEKRFLPPIPARAWQGTLKATAFPNMAMQNETPNYLGGANSPDMSEDALFLNVFTPSTEGRHRPVLFWIHGGASAGSANDHDGSALAQQGDVVVVAVNYRLGIFGFLDLSHFGEAFAGSASNGIRDQILALQWVRDNIADYGGDAGNVTIFGESSGGRSVQALLASPAATGLYHKVIMHSAAAVNIPPTDYTKDLAEHLDIDVSELPAALMGASAEDLLAAQQAINFSGGATIDGQVVTRPTLKAVAERGREAVPIIVGSNRDEGTLFSYLIPWPFYGPVGKATAAETLGGNDPSAYLARMKEAWPDEGRTERFERIWTDRYRKSAIDLAEAASAAGTDVWLYRFDYPLPASVGNGRLGATHAAEIPFTFNGFATDAPDNAFWYDRNGPKVQRLARLWSDSIIAFARTGNPNGAGLPHWPRYTAEDRRSLILDAEPKVVEFLDKRDRQVWSDVKE